jgi:hypothetical protein
MAKLLKNFIVKFLQILLVKYLEDFFIVAGLVIVVWTTYTINPLIAHYLIGAILLIIGLVIARR